MSLLFFMIHFLFFLVATGIVLKLSLRKKIASIDGFNGIRNGTDDLGETKIIGNFGEE